MAMQPIVPTNVWPASAMRPAIGADSAPAAPTREKTAMPR